MSLFCSFEKNECRDSCRFFEMEAVLRSPRELFKTSHISPFKHKYLNLTWIFNTLCLHMAIASLTTSHSRRLQKTTEQPKRNGDVKYYNYINCPIIIACLRNYLQCIGDVASARSLKHLRVGETADNYALLLGNSIKMRSKLPLLKTFHHLVPHHSRNLQ